jgi:hypothetical protein
VGFRGPSSMVTNAGSRDGKPQTASENWGLGGHICGISGTLT